MAYGGARGGTEARMAQTPNFLPQEGQHPTFNALDRRGSRSESEEGDSGTPFRLNVANAVRGQRGHRFEGAHPDTLARHHGAGLQTPGFRQTEAATGEIDGWVAGETEGRIGDLLPPGHHRTGYAHGPDRRDPLQRLLVVQVRERRNGRRAVHAPRRRGGDGGDDAPGIPLLVRGSADYKAARLPYGGAAADMLIIPPDEGGFGQVEGRLGAALLDEVRGNLLETQVELTDAALRLRDGP